MADQISHEHHYVPRWYQKRFLAPGEEKARGYHVLYDAKIKGPDPKVLHAVRSAKVGDRVEFDWVQTGHGPAIKSFRITRKAVKQSD